MKQCSKCLEIKELGEFYTRKISKDGFYGKCKLCASVENKKWRTENVERKRQLDANYRQNNKDKVNGYRLKWAKNNPEKLVESRKKWRNKNPDKCRGYWQKHNSRCDRKIRARKCSWADINKIKDIYRKCRQISRVTGIQHHVDHIVPLCSDRVCGLHYECNLQIIPATDNLRKSNKVI